MEIIAEIGQNYNGDLGLARELIHAAKDNGADVAKFQLFDAEALFSKDDNPWYEYNLKSTLSRDDLALLAAECTKAGIEFMASVFDSERVAWLEAVGVQRYKLASRSIEDQMLFQTVAATGRPILVSLGWWKQADFPTLAAPGGVQYLYCVSKYPTPLADVHLSAVDFDRYAGFSDHTEGLVAPMAAFARGAGIVEKHFTLDKTMYGPDHAGSMTPIELRQLADFRDQLRLCL